MGFTTKTLRRAALPAAFLMLAAIGLLDLLTPPDVDFTEFYVLPVALVAWAYGWRAGIALAVLVTTTEVIVDSSLLRLGANGSTLPTIAWNALSDLGVFSLVAAIVDQVRREREHSRTVNEDRARLLRLLEREFPRPLRAIDWFARSFEERSGDAPGSTGIGREHFAGLRHHVREVAFLATDLIRIGRLNSGELAFTPAPIDLKSIASDAASQVLDRNRVLFSASAEMLTVWADAEPLHHAISAVIGRLIEQAPVHEVVHVFVRGSGNEAVVEFTSRAYTIAPDAFELADLLTQANGGRLVIIPRGGDLGVRVNLYMPRSKTTVPHREPADTMVAGVRPD